MRSSGGDRTIFAVLAVPNLSGDYEGEVLITAAGGRPRDLGRIGLRICIDEGGSGPLRGVLDAKGSLVFSSNIMLIGGFIEPARRRFVLAGSMTLPARPAASPGSDQPPTDNPLPTRLIRDVSLVGTEARPGTLHGDYSEVIRGPLPFPVVLTGSFDLRRVADPRRRR